MSCHSFQLYSGLTIHTAWRGKNIYTIYTNKIPLFATKIFSVHLENYFKACKTSLEINVSFNALFFFNIAIGIIFNKPLVLKIWLVNLFKYGNHTNKIKKIRTTKNTPNFIL